MTTAIAAVVLSAVSQSPQSDVRLLDAVRFVESGNQVSPPDGDGGRAIGPYQIWRVYWQDSGVPGRYEDCRDRAYAEKVVRAYWHRYCPRGTDEQKARIHNGGPKGDHNPRTMQYWRKVQRAMGK